jgi:ABC-type molybdate transport system substrate-binding protein
MQACLIKLKALYKMISDRIMMATFKGKAVGLALLVVAGSSAAACADTVPHLVIASAGSLSSSFAPVQKLFTERTGVCVDLLAGGSVKLARDLKGQRAIDIFASADAEVNERMLKPAGVVPYTIRFAEGSMVLAYTSASRQAATIAADGKVAADWTAQLLQPGVTIGGSHPFLDPGGYRADMVLQLAQIEARQAGLYNALLGHAVLTRPGDVLGTSFDYQFTYAHSARAAKAADKTGAYRYAILPDTVCMAAPPRGPFAKVGVTMPGVDGPESLPVRIPATRVTWGLSIVDGAPNAKLAEQFLQLFFSAEGVALRAAGPDAIDPPQVAAADIARLPKSLRPLVRATPH